MTKAELGNYRQQLLELGKGLKSNVSDLEHEAFQKAEIQNHLHCIAAESVLRDAHAPDQDTGFGPVNEFGEFFHARTRKAGLGFQIFEFEM